MISLGEWLTQIINIEPDARLWLVMDRELQLTRLDKTYKGFMLDYYDIDSYCDGWIKGVTIYLNPVSKKEFNKRYRKKEIEGG